MPLLLLALPAALLACELLLRWLDLPAFTRTVPGWEWQTLDPVLGWRNKPGYARPDFRLAGLGLRGEGAGPKKAGTLRILCMGDSGTFGVWLETPPFQLRFDNYPEELAALLRAAGHEGAEVLNAGVLGHTSSHGLRHLLSELLELRPDVLVVRFGFNDHNVAWDASRRAEEPRSKALRGLFYLVCRWRLTRLFLWLYHALAPCPPPMTVRWVPLERFEANLRRFAEVARERGIRLFFMDYPLRPIERGESPGLPPPYPLLGVANLAELHRIHGEYQDALRRVAQEAGVPLVETRPVLDKFPQSFFSDFDLIHPNRRGARALALALQQALKREGLLPHAAGEAIVARSA